MLTWLDLMKGFIPKSNCDCGWEVICPLWPLKRGFVRWRPRVGENLSWITPGPVPMPIPAHINAVNMKTWHIHQETVDQYNSQVLNSPGIWPNISANPPRVSLSSFILFGMKGPSRKKSILIPWFMGGIKTPKSFTKGKIKTTNNQHYINFSIYNI